MHPPMDWRLILDRFRTQRAHSAPRPPQRCPKYLRPPSSTSQLTEAATQTEETPLNRDKLLSAGLRFRPL